MKTIILRSFIILGSFGLMVFDGILLDKIFKQLPSVKGTQYVVPLRRDDMQFNSPTLKYYYEPVSNQTQVHDPDWLGYKTENPINADGLNDTKDYDIVKKPGTFRIAAIGDSFTYGIFVNTSENWTEILEEYLNSKLNCVNFSEFEMINFGVPGYDIEYITERYARKGTKYSPDLIIWLMNRFTLEIAYELLYPYLDKYEKLGVPMFDPQSKKHIRYLKAFSDLTRDISSPEIAAYQRKRLKKLSQLTDNKLLIFSFNIDEWSEQKWGELNTIMSGFKEVDGSLDFLKDDYYTLLDSHPNVRGHRKIAETLFDYLRKKYFEKCTLIDL